MFPISLGRRVRHLALAGLLLLAGWQLAGAGWIHGKALLAQQLLGRAWLESAATGVAQKPWPWADTWPVARLRVPGLQVEQYVLAGTSGQALAFGPGMHEAFAGGARNWTVLAGHRDTHFGFLGALVPGVRLSLELPDGELRDYQVQSSRVVDSRVERLDPPPVDRPHLLLVTCYPFASVAANGPLRFVVVARAVYGFSKATSASPGATHASGSSFATRSSSSRAV
ncbi:class GN sortase [Haliea sp. E1-2-M8]|uniref:class GN sortase n=1 Tax=Haliea sp. E1-2-M8 TaxID=3064706 RepID=UPI002717570D|nr:class GN sortase [Haliea sp. E1-2-M8]MDO8862293.1 class GN sortase [Haliea sp. E1-2-M8]